MNKVLIKIYVPSLEKNYDIFIPVNELIWKVNKLIVKSINDLSEGHLNPNKDYVFVNAETGQIYDNNLLIINTDIRNSSKLLLLEV